MADQRVERYTLVDPCGCIVTVAPGHRHTKLCAECRLKYFGAATRKTFTELVRDNLDLIG